MNCFVMLNGEIDVDEFENRTWVYIHPYSRSHKDADECMAKLITKYDPFATCGDTHLKPRVLRCIEQPVFLCNPQFLIN